MTNEKDRPSDDVPNPGANMMAKYVKKYNKKKYLKKYNKRIQQLIREATGENMERPPFFKDYEEEDEYE